MCVVHVEGRVFMVRTLNYLENTPKSERGGGGGGADSHHLVADWRRKELAVVLKPLVNIIENDWVFTGRHCVAIGTRPLLN